MNRHISKSQRTSSAPIESPRRRGNSPLLLVLLMGLLLLAACNPETPSQEDGGNIRGEIIVDGGQQTFVYSAPVSVQELLRKENITVDPLDRVSPSLFTQITDGMTITIVRVRQESVCDEEVIPFTERQLSRIDLEPGATIIGQQGKNGRQEACYLITYENGTETARAFQRKVPLEDAIEQIVYIGVSDSLEPVAIEGRLAYISGRQAWVMEGSNSTRRPLTTDARLDGRVFELSPDGRMLVFTQLTASEDDLDFSNELWLINDIFNGTSVKLQQIDILGADWVPGRANTLAYTSATAGGGSQGWSAFNDLWLLEIDPRSGNTISIADIIDQNVSGAFAYWGTGFQWSQDGSQVAYAKAEGVGLVDFEGHDFGEFKLAYPYFNGAITNEWVWQPELSWSPDGRWVVTMIHGAPYGAEAPIDSVVFNIAIFEVDPANPNGLVISNLVQQAGIWARPKFSPTQADGAYQIAYLQARTPLNSVGTEYDLYIMDRDGSNRTKLFPQEGRPGIRPISLDGEFVWSPSGNQIAIVYQSDIWVVDVTSGLAQKATNDQQSSSPRWTR